MQIRDSSHETLTLFYGMSKQKINMSSDEFCLKSTEVYYSLYWHFNT